MQTLTILLFIQCYLHCTARVPVTAEIEPCVFSAEISSTDCVIVLHQLLDNAGELRWNITIWKIILYCKTYPPHVDFGFSHANY